jgi:hypothetical protein
MYSALFSPIPYEKKMQTLVRKNRLLHDLSDYYDTSGPYFHFLQLFPASMDKQSE